MGRGIRLKSYRLPMASFLWPDTLLRFKLMGWNRPGKRVGLPLSKEIPDSTGARYPRVNPTHGSQKTS